MLRPEEVEMLVCGSPTLDLNELRKVTEYDGYKADDPIIMYVLPFSYHVSLHYAPGISKTTSLMSKETHYLFMGQLKDYFCLNTKNTNWDYLIIQLEAGVKILIKWPYILSWELSKGSCPLTCASLFASSGRIWKPLS
jgi:hypothetical protein